MTRHPAIQAGAGRAPVDAKAGIDQRRVPRWQLATLTAASGALIALFVAGGPSRPLPAGSIITPPSSRSVGAGFAPEGQPAVVAAATSTHDAISYSDDPAACAQYPDKKDVCTRARELLALMSAVGEPLRQDQIGPLMNALANADLAPSAKAGGTSAIPSDQAQQLTRLERAVVEAQSRAATLVRAAAPLLSPTQLTHFGRHLDEEREARQIELDVARETAGASTP